jgi:hypothetical protein
MNWENNTKLVVTTPTCIHCNETGVLIVDKDKYKEFRETPRHLRRLIQDIFPDTSRGEREQLINGTHPECFDDMFIGEGE